MTNQDHVYVAYGLAPWRILIAQTQANIAQQKKKIHTKQTECSKILTKMGEITRRRGGLSKRIDHETIHLGREIADLLAKDEVTKIEVLPNGIRLTTKPIHSFKGKYPFEIDLTIGGNKPTFRIVGQGNDFHLRCLNGAGHDTNVTALLQEARLAEAAVLALDLIQFGDEGGPHNDDNNDYNY